MNSPELVNDISEVKVNMVRFKKAFEDGNDDIVRKLTMFKRWYYDREQDLFAPSKFIGYKDMTSYVYQELSNKVMDGRETEKVLKKLSFEPKDFNHEEKLKNQLQSILDKYDKKIRKNAVIRILK